MKYYDQVVDTVLTDRQGHYALSFTNIKGLFYGLNCGGLEDYATARPGKLDFPDSLVNGAGGYPSLATVDLALGRANNLNFRPSPRRVWLVQVATRTTGYERLYFAPLLSQGQFNTLPANNQRRLVLVYRSVPFTTAALQNFYQPPGVALAAHFARQPPTGAAQDTTVQLKVSTPLTGDTVRASLMFGR